MFCSKKKKNPANRQMFCTKKKPQLSTLQNDREMFIPQNNPDHNILKQWTNFFFIFYFG